MIQFYHTNQNNNGDEKHTDLTTRETVKNETDIKSLYS